MYNLRYAFRYLWRNKTSSLLNIAGLSLGITSALLLFLFIRHELSFDSFHSKKERIYRVCMELSRNGDISKDGATPLALKETLEQNFSLLENTAAVYYDYNGALIIDPDNKTGAVKKFKEESGIAYVTPSFYEIFDFKWIIGDYKKVLSEPNSAAISKSMARKYFGVNDGAYQEAIGHTLKLNNEVLLTVNGIVDDPPANSDFPFKIVISHITHYNNNKEEYDKWESVYSATNHYALLRKGIEQKDFDARLASFAAEKFKDDQSGTKTSLFSQPLTELHYDAGLGNYNNKTANKKTLLALGLIGLFLVITACVNFINLATAQAVKRSKEVGIKKTIGAGRGSLFSYFMGEVTIIVFFSAAFSVVLGELLTPFLSEKLELGIAYNSLTDFYSLGFLGALSILTIFIAGFYPSFLMSNAAPVKAMHGGLSGGSNKGGLLLRRSLVVFQFALSQILIISVIVISEQTEFFRTKDLGFNKDLVLLTYIPKQEYAQKDYIYNSLTKLSAVKDVSFSLNPPSNLGAAFTTYVNAGSENAMDIGVELKPVDPKYIDMYGLTLLAGRNFNETDHLGQIIVNEAFLRKAGIAGPEEAVGRRFMTGINNSNAEIIGVLKDFYLADLRREIYPMIMENLKPPLDLFGFYANIKFKEFGSNQEIQNAIKEIENIWNAAFPDEIFESRFLDDALYKSYSDEEKMSNIMKFFAVIAVLIGCVDLYGLIIFIAAQKTKEIGVRKVLGASVSGIVGLLSKEFMALMGISFLVSWPVSYYLMSKWLEDYHYKIELGFGIFALAGLIAFAVSMTTITYQAVKAATVNPVKSLKYE